MKPAHIMIMFPLVDWWSMIILHLRVCYFGCLVFKNQHCWYIFFNQLKSEEPYLIFLVCLLWLHSYGTRAWELYKFHFSWYEEYQVQIIMLVKIFIYHKIQCQTYLVFITFIWKKKIFTYEKCLPCFFTLE